MFTYCWNLHQYTLVLNSKIWKRASQTMPYTCMFNCLLLVHACNAFMQVIFDQRANQRKTGKMTIKSFDMKSETFLIIIEMYIGVCTREKGRLIVHYCYINISTDEDSRASFHFLSGHRQNMLPCLLQRYTLQEA